MSVAATAATGLHARPGLLAALLLAVAGAAWCGVPAEPAEPSVSLHQGGWRLEPRDASGAALVQALAMASGSELHASVDALAGLRPLRRPVQAASLAGAWQAVLAPSTSHALQCGRSRCRVWILPSAPVAKARTDAPVTTREPDPAVAVNHPGSAVALEPDPPGLFPSE